MNKEKVGGLGVISSGDFPKSQVSYNLCFGTTEFQPTNRICKACSQYLECGVVFPKKIRQRINVKHHGKISKKQNKQ